MKFATYATLACAGLSALLSTNKVNAVTVPTQAAVAQRDLSPTDPGFGQSIASSVRAMVSDRRAEASSIVASGTTTMFSQSTGGPCQGIVQNGRCCKGSIINGKCYVTDGTYASFDDSVSTDSTSQSENNGMTNVSGEGNTICRRQDTQVSNNGNTNISGANSGSSGDSDCVESSGSSSSSGNGQSSSSSSSSTDSNPNGASSQSTNIVALAALPIVLFAML